MQNKFCEILTPTGRGAVATVRVRGTEAIDRLFRAANGRSAAEQPVDRVCFGHWGITNPQEELVVVSRGDGEFEVHCHGGAACVSRIVDDLAAAGAPVLPAAEPTVLSELENTIRSASTLKTATIALKQKRLWSEFLKQLPCMESGKAVAELMRVLEWSWVGTHLVEPFRIAIIGSPNVGKSTLLNAIVGFQRAIVFDQPGTTRDVVSVRSVMDGWPVLFSDTAGLRESPDSIESRGVAAAQRLADEVDLCVVVSDLSATEPAAFPLDNLRVEKTLRVGNKSDLVDATARSVADVNITISAESGEGIDLLLSTIAERLVPNEPPADRCIPISSRHADLIKQVVDLLNAGKTQQAEVILGGQSV